MCVHPILLCEQIESTHPANLDRSSSVPFYTSTRTVAAPPLTQILLGDSHGLEIELFFSIYDIFLVALPMKKVIVILFNIHIPIIIF